MSEPSAEPTGEPSAGPVLLAYDGSELAAHAIAEAGRQLAAGRSAVVVTVWQPADVGFEAHDPHLDANDAEAVRRAADAVVARGVELARQAGFSATGRAVEAAPTWRGVVDAATELDAGLLVLGPHARRGLGHVLGSVTRAVFEHSAIPLLAVRSAT